MSGQETFQSILERQKGFMEEQNRQFLLSNSWLRLVTRILHTNSLRRKSER